MTLEDCQVLYADQVLCCDGNPDRTHVLDSQASSNALSTGSSTQPAAPSIRHVSLVVA